jgi:hypothetical protein
MNFSTHNNESDFGYYVKAKADSSAADISPFLLIVGTLSECLSL